MMASSRFIQKKRTSNFREDETKLLIQLWGSPHVQNKLYLTHRKAPVMRILAASMQQHGFYRTPDEIKTRIRNLKCLYHRIKRSVQSGAGLGTIDPDWPHFKAMDDILTKQSQRHKENPYKDNIFDGPRCEDIKQEVDDIDINDDMESYTTNSLGGSDYEEEAPPSQPPPLTPAPAKETKKGGEVQTPKNGGTTAVSAANGKQYQSGTTKTLPNILPNLSIPIQNHQVSTSGGGLKPPNPMQSLPFPLLILNGIQPQQGQPNVSLLDKSKAANLMTNIALNGTGIKQLKNVNAIANGNNSDLASYLKELVEIQRENLSIEKQRLEIDKQRLEIDKRRLEFEKAMTPQVLTIAPLLNDILNRAKSTFSNEQMILGSFGRQKRPNDIEENPKEAKILRSFLQANIKRSPSDIEDELSDNDDSGIQKDVGK